uniref:DNA-directed RNA polymerase RBP11-like dimerisation domain-containing protein n=1 Tax=Fibrocapsa japonica TaxID=94617 RepID=A0A6U1NZH5_9STRA|mmetsp:Transcript_23602/g.34321  ORF Transcript_23602/g.34321 Transcript_23602/m.34321 type:complete len:127 (+) Transcript_23602:212-592(+)
MNAQDRSQSYRLAEGEKKLTYEPDTKIPNAGTFTLNREDHTLGNLLRMQLLQDSSVRFAGYQHPHPLVHHLLVKIQTTDPPANPIQAMSTSIEDLSSEFDFLEQRFKEDIDRFKQDRQSGAGSMQF